MVGTKAGGLKARQTNIQKHGEDFYKRIGSKGGQAGHTGGFAADRALAKAAGRKGGLVSRRNGIGNGEGKKREHIWNPGEPMFSKEVES